jgi:hypothetical protein
MCIIPGDGGGFPFSSQLYVLVRPPPFAVCVIGFVEGFQIKLGKDKPQQPHRIVFGIKTPASIGRYS